jgi:hypothetical protein
MNLFLYYLDKMTAWLSFSWLLTIKEQPAKLNFDKYEKLLQVQE